MIDKAHPAIRDALRWRSDKCLRINPAAERKHDAQARGILTRILHAIDAQPPSPLKKPNMPKRQGVATDMNGRREAIYGQAMMERHHAAWEAYCAAILAAQAPDDAMVERALKVLAWESDGAIFPDNYGDDEAEAERETMRKVLSAALGVSDAT